MPSQVTVNPSVREIRGLLMHPDHQKITVSLAPTTRDAVGGHSPSTYLREGLVLVKITSGTHTGKYKHFDSVATDGSQLSDSAVVLTADHDMDIVEGYEVTGYFEATLRADKILVGSGFVYGDVQRLKFRVDAQDGN